MNVVALGTMRARSVTTGLPCGCEALRVRTRREALYTGTCRRFTLLQTAWSSGPFSSQEHGSSWAAAPNYLFVNLVTFINGINGENGLNLIKR